MSRDDFAESPPRSCCGCICEVCSSGHAVGSHSDECKTSIDGSEP